MPVLKRQDAFSKEQPSPFITYQCCICHEYEEYGDWAKVHCFCSRTDSYEYCHSYCLALANKCKICNQVYTAKQTKLIKEPMKYKMQRIVINYTKVLEKHKINTLITVAACITFLMFASLCSCVTIDKVSQQELNGLTDAEYLWLPRFHKKCFYLTTVSLLFRIYLFLVIFIIFYIKYLKHYS